jgi:hypothetical protein
MTTLSLKDLSITPSLSEVYSFHLQGSTHYKDLLSIYSRESFLKYQDVRYTC